MEYKCRFCKKVMEHSRLVHYIKKEGFNLGRVEFWQCKHCGIFLKEYIINYDKKQAKEIFEYFKDPIEIEAQIF